MRGAKTFLFVCLGGLCLVAPFHLGANRVSARLPFCQPCSTRGQHQRGPLKKPRFTASGFVAILQEGEAGGTSVNEHRLPNRQEA